MGLILLSICFFLIVICKGKTKKKLMKIDTIEMNLTNHGNDGMNLAIVEAQATPGLPENDETINSVEEGNVTQKVADDFNDTDEELFTEQATKTAGYDDANPDIFDGDDDLVDEDEDDEEDDEMD